MTYTASNGRSYTNQIDFSNLPSSTVAATVYLPDFNSSGGYTGTAAAVVTLLNTNGMYNVPNVGTFPIWDPFGPNFSSALQDVGAHETGHGFGLGDQSQCGDVMSPWQATTANPSGGTNNRSGCATAAVSRCDDQEVMNNPNGLYAPPPTCDCADIIGCLECNPSTCQCTAFSDHSPIIIAVGASAAYPLVAPQDGVWFDINADGVPDRIGWTAPGSAIAFLALDRNHNGLIDNGSELFGTSTPLGGNLIAGNGFEALAYYDRPENGGNGDGVLDARDSIWPQLILWIDTNHDGVSQREELHTPAEFGLTGIDLHVRSENRRDAYGNFFHYAARAYFGNQARVIYDVFFAARPRLVQAQARLELFRDVAVARGCKPDSPQSRSPD